MGTSGYSDLQEPAAFIHPQFSTQWHQAHSMQSAIVEEFTPWNLANTIN